MRQTLLPAIWLAALILLTATMFFLACSGSDNDDDDDDNDNDEATPDLNGWTDEDGTLIFEDEDNQQCPPPMPEGIGEYSLQLILDDYTGSYQDEFGNDRAVACDPQGRWELSCYDLDSFCDPIWNVPVLVTIAGQEQSPAGFIVENYFSPGSGQLNYSYDDLHFYGDPFETADGEYKIVFNDPTFGAVWTKQE
ncbi:MAG TPA: hypothetical protein PKW95_12975 [bacterium]|nr:hypothetical protein [bacterium]